MSSPGVRIDRGGETKVSKPATPKAIDAHSQSRNSFAKIVIIGVLLALLTLALFVALIWRPEHTKDLLLVIGSIAAYIAGSSESSRKDEK